MIRTYQTVLKEMGWPTNVLVLDFEAYFDKKIGLGFDGYKNKKKGIKYPGQSSVEYVTDPRWETIGVGFQYLRGALHPSRPRWIMGPFVKKWIDHLITLHGKDLEGVVVVAKNCKFDILVLQMLYGVTPKYTVDIDDLLRWFDPKMSHKLKDAAPLFGLPPKGDTMQFEGMKLLDLMNNGKYQDMVDYCKRDIEGEVGLFKILMPMLDNPSFELELARATLEMYLYPAFDFDFELADELIRKMNAIYQEAMHDYKPALLNSPIQMYHELRRVLPDDEPVPIKKSKPSKATKPKKNPTKMDLLIGKGNTLALAKTDDAVVKLQAHPLEEVRNLVEARLAVKSWPSHINRIERMVRQARASGGKLRIPLKSFGAHTGRWSGDEGINPQNYGSRGAELITMVRKLLRAPEGCDIVLADSSQIEARDLAWTAGQQDLVDQFAEGRCTYSEFAISVFNEPTWKWNDKVDKEEYAGQKKDVKTRRDFGKEGIVGGGYGMGGAKFHIRCLQSPALRPKYEDGTYDEAFSHSVVTTYRNKYRKIVRFWSVIENTFRSVSQHPGLGKMKYHIPGTHVGLTLWNNGKGTTFIQLPSGRCLRYRNVKVARDGSISYRWGKLYGGLLTENIIQAMSRDFLGHWILEMRKRGYRCVLTVHAEVIFIVPKSESKKVQALVERLMVAPISWAPGMPYGVESQIAETYTK